MNKIILIISAVTLQLIGQQASAEIYGVVIGIDAYKNYGTLDGAVNDAKMVADSLNAVGAKQVKLLLDDKASRDEIKKAWDDVSTQAKKGDTVFFTYAGHGAQLPERVKGTEADGQDEFYVLANFDDSGKNSYERLIDDDLQEWFNKRPDLNIILVSDSCHSGTMTRSYKKSMLKYRKAHVRAITNDALPVSTNPDIIDEQKTKLTHVISFSGVPDNEEVPEVEIESQPHGALSWHFAKGLIGKADINNDGAVSLSELKNYLIEKVQEQTEGQQHPQISFMNDMAIVQKDNSKIKSEFVTFSIANNQNNAPLVNSVLANLKNIKLVENEKGGLEWNVDDNEIRDQSNNLIYSLPIDNKNKAYKRQYQLTETKIHQVIVDLIQPIINDFLTKTNIDSKAGLVGDLNSIPFSISKNPDYDSYANTISEKLSGIQLVEHGKSSLEWDVDSGVIRNQFDDIVYNFSNTESQTRAYRRKDQPNEVVSPEVVNRLQLVINKYRFIDKLKQLSNGSLELKLQPSDKLHVKGEAVTFEVARLKYGYFTLINFAVDGTVNFLYPSAQYNDPLIIPQDKPYKLKLEVSEPFGADHFVVIVSDKPLSSLHDVLKKLNATSSSLDVLRETLQTALKDTNFQIGIHASFTASSL